MIYKLYKKTFNPWLIFHFAEIDFSSKIIVPSSWECTILMGTLPSVPVGISRRNIVDDFFPKMIIFSILLHFVASKNETTIAIFNNWTAKNVPVLFRWTGDDEVVTNVKTYENPENFQIKWACSAQLGHKKYIFGGAYWGGGDVTEVYEIVNCGVKSTNIKVRR